MKKLLLILLASFTTIMLHAQLEVKLTPIEVFWGAPNLFVEYSPTENIGAEIGVGFRNGSLTLEDIDFSRKGNIFFLAGKYYVSPTTTADGFGVGAYIKIKDIDYTAKNEDFQDQDFTNSSIGLGVLATYKYVSEMGILVGIDAGIGRNFRNKLKYDNTDKGTVSLSAIPFVNTSLIGRLVVGYRF